MKFKDQMQEFYEDHRSSIITLGFYGAIAIAFGAACNKVYRNIYAKGANATWNTIANTMMQEDPETFAKMWRVLDGKKLLKK